MITESPKVLEFKVITVSYKELLINCLQRLKAKKWLQDFTLSETDYKPLLKLSDYKALCKQKWLQAFVKFLTLNWLQT